MNTETAQQQANEYALQKGYVGANWLISIESAEVYAPVRPANAPRQFIGFPVFILVFPEGVRSSKSLAETQAIMDAIADAKEAAEDAAI